MTLTDSDREAIDRIILAHMKDGYCSPWSAELAVHFKAIGRAEAIAEAVRAHDALRTLALVKVQGRGPTGNGHWGAMIDCRLCRNGWYENEPERHAAGCLASLADA